MHPPGIPMVQFFCEYRPAGPDFVGLQQHGNAPVSSRFDPGFGQQRSPGGRESRSAFFGRLCPFAGLLRRFGPIDPRALSETGGGSFCRSRYSPGCAPRDILWKTSPPTLAKIFSSRAGCWTKKAPPEKILLCKNHICCAGHMPRQKSMPEVDFLVTGPQISFTEYPTDKIPKDLLINIRGETRRDPEYPRLGFQIPQEMPGRCGLPAAS